MVGFRTPAGEWVRVASGESMFEAASKALEFFASDGWYGPRPRPETILEVSAVGDGKVYRIRCGRVMEWGAEFVRRVSNKADKNR